MTWNYRVVKKKYNDYVSYGIHEVFYDDNGNIEGCTEEPIDVSADSLEELKEVYNMMAEAFEQEVVEYEKVGQMEIGDTE